MKLLSSSNEGTERLPPRLIEGGGSELERRLIQSAERDRAPGAAKARVEASLRNVFVSNAGRLTTAGGSFSASQAAASQSGGVAWGMGALGLGVGVVALAVWFGSKPGPEERAERLEARAVEGRAVEARAVEARPAEPLAAPRAELTDATVSRGGVFASSSRALQPPRPAAAAQPLAPGASAAAGGLLDEVRALDAVTAAIEGRRAELAARQLDEYRRRFPRGELFIEADVLGIQVAMARGDRPLASELGQAVLARPEAERYYPRVRALLGGAAPRSTAAGQTPARATAARDPAGAPKDRRAAPLVRSKPTPAHMRERR